MARELLSVLRFAVVAALPGTAAKGDGCVLSGDGHLYVYDGAAWVDHGASGGGSGGPAGVSQAAVDFGSTPYPSRTFDVADSLAATSQNVLASIAADADGEFEATPLAVAAYVPSAGTIRVIVTATQPGGMVSGIVRVNYLLGNTPHAETTQLEGTSGTFDDYPVNGHRILKFQAAVTLTGIAAPAAGQPRVLHIIAPANCVLHHLDAGSAAANQFSLGIYAPSATINTGTLVYDDDSALWRPAAAF